MEFVGHETYFFNKAVEQLEKLQELINEVISINEYTYNSHSKEFTMFLVDEIEYYDRRYLNDVYYEDEDENKSYIVLSDLIEKAVIHYSKNKNDIRIYFNEFNEE